MRKETGGYPDFLTRGPSRRLSRRSSWSGNEELRRATHIDRDVTRAPGLLAGRPWFVVQMRVLRWPLELHAAHSPCRYRRIDISPPIRVDVRCEGFAIMLANEDQIQESVAWICIRREHDARPDRRDVHHL